MVNFILLANATEDVDRFRNGRLVDYDLGESALKSGILLDVLAVFTGCGMNKKERQVLAR